MICTVPKSDAEVLAAIPAGLPVGIVGCGDCAAALGTGGTRQVDAWVERFADRNPVVFATVLGSPCDQRNLRRLLPLIARFDEARVLLLLACDAADASVGDWLGTLPTPPRVVLALTTTGLTWIGRNGTRHTQATLSPAVATSLDPGTAPAAGHAIAAQAAPAPDQAGSDRDGDRPARTGPGASPRGSAAPAAGSATGPRQPSARSGQPVDATVSPATGGCAVGQRR